MVSSQYYSYELNAYIRAKPIMHFYLKGRGFFEVVYL